MALVLLGAGPGFSPGEGARAEGPLVYREHLSRSV